MRFSDAAFAIALSGGGLSPAQQELLDTEYELRQAGSIAPSSGAAFVRLGAESRIDHHCRTSLGRGALGAEWQPRWLSTRELLNYTFAASPAATFG